MVETKRTRTIKNMFGVPSSMYSCHTATIGNYFIEGHIPADDIKRLMREEPDIRGLIVPGMPGGSPGMESSPYQPYKVLSVDKKGNYKVFSSH